jgi:hypothetical protein
VELGLGAGLSVGEYRMTSWGWYEDTQKSWRYVVWANAELSATVRIERRGYLRFYGGVGRMLGGGGVTCSDINKDSSYGPLGPSPAPAGACDRFGGETTPYAGIALGIRLGG